MFSDDHRCLWIFSRYSTDDPQLFIPAIRWSTAIWWSPAIQWSPAIWWSPAIRCMYEVWTLINQKSSVIPPSLMVLLVAKMSYTHFFVTNTINTYFFVAHFLLQKRFTHTFFVAKNIHALFCHNKNLRTLFCRENSKLKTYWGFYCCWCWIVLATVCCRFGSWGLVIKLNFCSDFQHKVWSGVLRRSSGEILKLKFGQYFAAHPCLRLRS